MSGAPRPESLNRLTDIVVDKTTSRLGTSGIALADDLVLRIDQSLGLPLEISAQTPASTLLNVGSAVYTMPSGARVAILDEASRVALSAGTINLASGVITTGSNASFAPPSIGPGQYMKALVQFKHDSAALTVSFGSAASSIQLAGDPPLIFGFSPVCQVELHSTSGGFGAFDNVAQANLVFLAGGIVSGRGPLIEQQTVTATTQTLFTLATITIPVNRSKLWVWENGIRLFADAYSVPSDNTISLVDPAPQNAVMTFEVRN